MPPTSTLGSTPPLVSSQPVSDVVVVLPCVPAMTIDRAPQRKCSRIASGSEQYRILRSSTSSSSGLPREIALPTIDQVEIGRDVLRLVTAARDHAFGRQEIAHRRVDVLVRPANIESLPLQHGGQRGHGRAADADEVHARAHATAASSMMSRGARHRHHPAPDAEGQASSPGRSCGPRESRRRPDRETRRSNSAIDAARRGLPRMARSQRGSSPMTTALARPSRLALPQLDDHAIQPVRTLADLLEEQHIPGRRIERERRRRATPGSGSPCHRAAGPRASPGLSGFEPGGRQLTQRAPCGTGRARTSRGRSRRSPRPSRPASIGP